jgi:hypothetical protein
VLAWDHFFRLFYALVRLLDPLVRISRRVVGPLNVVDLTTTGRRTGRRRSVLLTLLDVDGRWYLGHPSGEVGWTRNVAAGPAEIRIGTSSPIEVRAFRLEPGAERERAIRAGWSQHPFGGSLVYWIARNHVRQHGVFFRIERAAQNGASPAEARWSS